MVQARLDALSRTVLSCSLSRFDEHLVEALADCRSDVLQYLKTSRAPQGGERSYRPTVCRTLRVGGSCVKLQPLLLGGNDGGHSCLTWRTIETCAGAPPGNRCLSLDCPFVGVCTGCYGANAPNQHRRDLCRRYAGLFRLHGCLSWGFLGCDIVDRCLDCSSVDHRASPQLGRDCLSRRRTTVR